MAHGETFRVAQGRLREYIGDHQLGPGDALPPEAKLAEHLGISRISLREATRSLQTLGVIEARNGRGLFVSQFSFRPILDQLPYGLATGGASLHEVLVVRETLEEGLIEMAAKRLRPEDFSELDRLVDQMERHERAGEPTDEVDKAFHQCLYRPLGNTLVSALIDVFWELFYRLRGSLPGKPGYPAALHRDIVTALRTGDELTEAMRAHFTYIRNRLEPLASTGESRDVP